VARGPARRHFGRGTPVRQHQQTVGVTTHSPDGP
jgi:hypothetical protein